MKLKMGIIASDARGTIGGVVFSRNKGGAYARQKVSPVQPQTNWQLLQRAAFKQLSATWASPSFAGDRAAWATWALTHPVTDVFGASMILSGLACFQRCNRVAAAVGGVLISDPPATFTVTALSSLDCTLAAADGVLTSLIIDGLPTPLAANEFLYVWATDKIVPGVLNYNNRLRLISQASNPAILAADLVEDYNTRLDSPQLAANDQVGLLVSVANALTGAVSPGLKVLYAI